MSDENVEVVRRVLSGWERGDFSSSDWQHPEIEFVVADGPDPGTRTGVAGMGEGSRNFMSACASRRTSAAPSTTSVFSCSFG